MREAYEAFIATQKPLIETRAFMSQHMEQLHGSLVLKQASCITFYLLSQSVIIEAKSGSEPKDAKLDVSSVSSRLLIIRSFAHHPFHPNPSLHVPHLQEGPTRCFQGSRQEGREGKEGRDVSVRGRFAGEECPIQALWWGVWLEDWQTWSVAPS